jgi:hypothetical protein
MSMHLYESITDIYVYAYMKVSLVYIGIDIEYHSISIHAIQNINECTLDSTTRKTCSYQYNRSHICLCICMCLISAHMEVYT